MARFTIVIQYDNVEAYQHHGPRIEETIKNAFAEKGAVEQTLFISTRSIPPIHTTTLNAPDDVSLEDLKIVTLPEGVYFDIHQEA